MFSVYVKPRGTQSEFNYITRFITVGHVTSKVSNELIDIIVFSFTSSV